MLRGRLLVITELGLSLELVVRALPENRNYSVICRKSKIHYVVWQTTMKAVGNWKGLKI